MRQIGHIDDFKNKTSVNPYVIAAKKDDKYFLGLFFHITRPDEKNINWIKGDIDPNHLPTTAPLIKVSGRKKSIKTRIAQRLSNTLGTTRLHPISDAIEVWANGFVQSHYEQCVDLLEDAATSLGYKDQYEFISAMSGQSFRDIMG